MKSLLAKLKTVLLMDELRARQRAHVAICQSKALFLTQAEVKRHLRKGLSRGGDPRFRSYKCPVCGFWHITTKRRKK